MASKQGHGCDLAQSLSHAICDNHFGFTVCMHHLFPLSLFAAIQLLLLFCSLIAIIRIWIFIKIAIISFSNWLLFLRFPLSPLFVADELNLVLLSGHPWYPCSTSMNRKTNPLCIWIVELSCFLFSGKCLPCVWHWWCQPNIFHNLFCNNSRFLVVKRTTICILGCSVSIWWIVNAIVLITF